MTTGTDLDNEMRCAAAVRAALGDEYGTPAQTALRFVLGNRDMPTRVIGIAEIAQLDEALEAVAAGAVADAGDLQARRAVGQRFQARVDAARRPAL